ncbi:MAG: ABC transporter permease [Reichenbachiella sp.]|uniref:ABC transporter permease n=1 Tax=Reichenbachiella sp. TaxID=2184521 RepID=UPI0032630308
MLYNYIKIAIRTIQRDKFFSIINILGLAIGMATSLVIYQYVSFEKSFDGYHKLSDQIFRIRVEGQTYAGEMQFQSARCYPIVGPTVKERFPEVEEYARVFPWKMILSQQDDKIGKREFNEDKMCFVDPSFLDLFDVKIVSAHGETLLEEPNTFLISERMAEKYFGETDPVGKTLLVNGTDPVEVEGVFENIPKNSHLQYDFLTAYQTLGGGHFENSWGWNNVFVYLKIQENADIVKLEASFPTMIDEYKGDYFEATQYREDLYLQPLKSIHLNSNFQDEARVNGDGKTVKYLGMISVFVLLLAWINYINLTTAKSIQRAKEVGVRKTTGASRSSLITQFLMEAFLMNLISIVLALSLVQLFVPLFNAFAEMNIPFDLWTNAQFWFLLTGVLFTGSLLSGIYPALVLSGFDPIRVLKGSFTKSKEGQGIRKLLVVFQFASTVILVIGTAVIFYQIEYMRNKDLGIDLEQTLIIKGTNIYEGDSVGGEALLEQKINLFNQHLQSSPAIENVSVSEYIPSVSPHGWGGYIRRSGADLAEARAYQLQEIDHNYLDLYGIDLVGGRNFNQDKITDNRKLLINESAMRNLGFTTSEEAIGAFVIFPFVGQNDEEGEVIGVMKNWHQKSLHDEVSPIIFSYNPSQFSYVSVKINTKALNEDVQMIEETWQSVFAGVPFDYFFADDSFNQQYKSDQQFGKIVLLFSVLSIFIAILGLAGLSVFNCAQRIKEIGIRKTLGAPIFHLIYILSSEVLLLVGLAAIIGIPISYFAFDSWLAEFAFAASVSHWVYVLPVLGILLVSILIIGIQTVKTALGNPVDSLRYE